MKTSISSGTLSALLKQPKTERPSAIVSDFIGGLAQHPPSFRIATGVSQPVGKK